MTQKLGDAKEPLRVEASIFASSSFAASSAGANKGASQLSRVFSSAPGLSADDTRITIHLHDKATAAWGSGSSDVAALTKTQTSPFLSVKDGNVSPRSLFAAGKPDSRSAALHSECGQSVSPCFLISLRRHRAYEYTTEQRRDSSIQQRAQANRS